MVDFHLNPAYEDKTQEYFDRAEEFAYDGKISLMESYLRMASTHVLQEEINISEKVCIVDSIKDLRCRGYILAIDSLIAESEQNPLRITINTMLIPLYVNKLESLGVDEIEISEEMKELETIWKDYLSSKKHNASNTPKSL